MDRNWIKEKFADAFLSEPQKAALAAGALASIFAGIGELAKLGYRYDLVELVPEDRESIVEYPKMLYHDALGTRTVDNEVEENKLGPGWRTTPTLEFVPPPPSGKPVVPPPSSPPPEVIAKGASTSIDSTQSPSLVVDKQPAPAMTDKQVLDKRIAEGSGASTPNVDTDQDA